MERALKERIIGAIVLVAVVVLVVPVFRDGPPESDEVVSERVLLPGQSEQPAQTIVLERNRTEPVPAQATSEAPPSRSEPEQPQPAAANKPQDPPKEVASQPTQEPARNAEPSAEPPKVEPKNVEQAAATPARSEPQMASTTGMWAVQLGSFSSQENAEKLAADLRKQGFAAFLSQLDTASGKLHRVRVGPQKDRAAAEAMAARLKKSGHDSKILPHP